MGQGTRSARRDALGAREDERFRCRATVGRFGTKTAYRGRTLPTILLIDVRDAESCALLADHLWFTVGKWSCGLRPGDLVEFDGRVGSYVKGYQGRREDVRDSPVTQDWKVQRPTKVKNLGPSPDAPARAPVPVAAVRGSRRPKPRAAARAPSPVNERVRELDQERAEAVQAWMARGGADQDG